MSDAYYRIIYNKKEKKMKRKILLVSALMLIVSISFGQGFQVFVPQNGKFIGKPINLENLTIKSIVQYLGYNSEQVYSYFNTDISDTKIFAIVFKVFTDQIVFVVTNDSDVQLSAESVNHYLSNFDLNKVFDSYKIESTLDKGIKNKSLTSDYLASVLNLENPSPNGTIYASKIGYNLEFKQGVITSYNSSDGLNKWAKLWKEENYELYKSYEDAARKYWGDDLQKIIDEINIQADAFANTPEAFRNEYVKYHKTAEGTINFKMLLVAHYNVPMTLKEFKEINHGRYELTDEFNTPEGYKRTTYKVNKTLYTFSENGTLINSYTSNDGN